VLSDWKRSEGKAGTFKHTAGKWSGDPDDKGITFFFSFHFIHIINLSQIHSLNGLLCSPMLVTAFLPFRGNFFFKITKWDSF